MQIPSRLDCIFICRCLNNIMSIIITCMAVLTCILHDLAKCISYANEHVHLTLHSVSKETHHEFTGFPCDPGSRSSDPGGVTFDHPYLKAKWNSQQHSSIYTLPKKECNFPRCVSFETECNKSILNGVPSSLQAHLWDIIYARGIKNIS